MTHQTRWSLRMILLRWLVGLTLAIWALSALIVYVEADRESQELFDQSLEETAHLLLSLAEFEVLEHGTVAPIRMGIADEPNHRQYLLYQIWSSDARLLYRNAGAPATPLVPQHVHGLAWVKDGNAQSRVYASWNQQHSLQIQVAEPATHRKDISTRFAGKISGFALAFAAIAALAIWWSVGRAFAILKRTNDEVARRTPNDLADVILDGVPREVYPLLASINRLFGRVRRTMESEQRFTADAAHELRTPLAAIKTNLQVLQRARHAAERNEFIVGLGLSVDRASRLVDQLLTLSRLDPQSPGIEGFDELDLAALLAPQVPAWRALAEGHGLHLDTHLGAVRCAVNRDALLMLVRNLVDNAVRYTPVGGSIAIACREDAGRAVLEVNDTGPGIPADMHERVFERFFRLAGAHIPGSGLGLSIVRRIADLHGATVNLRCGPGQLGLTVTVTFPVARA